MSSASKSSYIPVYQHQHFDEYSDGYCKQQISAVRGKPTFTIQLSAAVDLAYQSLCGGVADENLKQEMEITAKSMHSAGLFDNTLLHPACDKYAISIKNAFDFLYPNVNLWIHK